MTNPTPERPPLWEVMRDAYIQSSGTLIDDLGREVLSGPDREEFAAMLRAIAKEIRHRWDADPPDDIAIEIVVWLLAEADRAEAG
jgi:hypothetical protein